MTRTYMRIMKPEPREIRTLQAAGVHMLEYCPMEMFTPHEQRAKLNHVGQSCQTLANRGGVSADEAVAILENRKWTMMSVVDAYRRLNELFEAAAATA